MASLIGTDPNQVPTNGMLGTMAFEDATNYRGFKLLASITPTVSANVESLLLFNSTYNNYLIVVDGVVPSATDQLLLRLATAGSAVTSGNYVVAPVGGASSTTGTSISISGNVTNTTGNASAEICIMNANEAARAKVISAVGASEAGVAGTFSGIDVKAAFTSAAAVSGFRLYWSGGANFVATGLVKVYGY